MGTLMLCLASFLAGGLAVIARIEHTTGPLVRQAERVAKAFTEGTGPLGEELQALSKTAYLRRKL